jgi:hypothetical protein
LVILSLFSYMVLILLKSSSVSGPCAIFVFILLL